MSDIQLIIGNKNYSSWSLRAWLGMKHMGVDFEEILVPLDMPDTEQNLARYASDNRVPVVKVGDHQIWDSLAILEFFADQEPDKILPQDTIARGIMRSLCAEMHSSFMALRNEMPMNCRRPVSAITLSDECKNDIARIEDLWQLATQYSTQQDRFLFGQFSLADAMFAPVVFRLDRYAIELNDNSSQYISHMLNTPYMLEWLEAAKREDWVIDHEDR